MPVTPVHPPSGIIPMLRQIHVPALWAVGADGTGVGVAVPDSGGDRTHPALAPAIVAGRSFLQGRDPDDWQDRHGHGTHCLGIVRQAAPGASLIVAQGLGDQGHGASSDLVAALDWCVQQLAPFPVKIISCSWGATGPEDEQLHAAFQRAEAAGCLIPAAAGNDGHRILTEDTVNWPARWPELMAVAATQQMVQHGDDVPAIYSGAGDKVALTAPGTDIESCAIGGGYLELSGTSMATPLVAAVAADLAHLFYIIVGRWPTRAELIAILLMHTRDIDGAGRDVLQGCGEIDAVPLTWRGAVSVQPGSAAVTYKRGAQSGARPLDIPAHIVDGHFEVEFRAMAEAMGARVEYDPQTQTGTALIDAVPEWPPDPT